jgi:hypothetical protein
MKKFIFLTGSGRSGSSWFGELLAANEQCKYEHEPFNPDKHPGPREPFIRRYFGPEADIPEYNRIMTWLTREDVVIKEIATTFATPYLQKHFSPHIIAIIRHPYSWWKSYERCVLKRAVPDFRYDEQLIDLYLYPFVDHMRECEYTNFITDVVSVFAARYYVMQHFNIKHWVTHEDLCFSPSTAFKKAGLNFNDRGAAHLRKRNSLDSQPFSRTRKTTEEPFKYKGKIYKEEKDWIDFAIEPFGMKDWGLWKEEFWNL